MSVLNKNNLLLFQTIIIIFTSWTIYYRLTPLPVFYVIFFILCLIFVNPGGIDKRGFLISLFLTMFLSRLLYFDSIDGYSATAILSTLVLILSVMILPMVGRENLETIYSYFNKIIAIILIPGILFHVLVMFEISTVYEAFRIQQYDTGFRVFNVYLFSSYQEGMNTRFASIFDEPGYLGTLCALILAKNGFNLRNKYNIVVLVAGFLSFSLAFYFLSAAYFALSLMSFDKESIGKVVVVALIFIVVIFIFREFVEGLIIERVVSPEEMLYGSHRGFYTTRMGLDYIFSQDTYSILIGKGRQVLRAVEHGIGVSWTHLLYQVGLIYFLLFFVGILFFSLNMSKQDKIALIIYAISIYQRPQIFTLVHMFLLVYFLNHNMTLYLLRKEKRLRSYSK